jgi:polysaccharide biosynthesis transport protein
MEVDATSNDPQEAADLSRAVVDAYLNEVVYAERDMKRQRLNELDKAYSEKDTEVRTKREQLKKLADQLGVSEKETLAFKQKLALEQLSFYRQQLVQAQFEVRRATKELAMQKAFLLDAKGQEVQEIHKDIRRLEISIAVMTDQEQNLRQEVQRQQSEAEKFGSSSVDVEMMRADIKNLDALLAGIATERDKLRIEVHAPARITLLQRADVPERPVWWW